MAYKGLLEQHRDDHLFRIRFCNGILRGLLDIEANVFNQLLEVSFLHPCFEEEIYRRGQLAIRHEARPVGTLQGQPLTMKIRVRFFEDQLEAFLVAHFFQVLEYGVADYFTRRQCCKVLIMLHLPEPFVDFSFAEVQASCEVLPCLTWRHLSLRLTVDAPEHFALVRVLEESSFFMLKFLFLLRFLWLSFSNS